MENRLHSGMFVVLPLENLVLQPLLHLSHLQDLIKKRVILTVSCGLHFRIATIFRRIGLERFNRADIRDE